MGTGSKYRKAKVLRVLERLAWKTGLFELKDATKENCKIQKVGGGESPYPVAANHRFISPHILAEVGKRLERWGVCTKDEFFEMIK